MRVRIIIVIFTKKSATARLTHSGKIGPIPSKGTTSSAQLLGSETSIKAKVAEKAIEKNSIASSIDPINEDTNGARHHTPFRKRLKIEISTSCTTRKAVPEPIAIRSVVKVFPSVSTSCDAIREHKTPTMKPTNTT